jgi:hypothetical protein
VQFLRHRQEITDVTQFHHHLQKQSSMPVAYIG